MTGDRPGYRPVIGPVNVLFTGTSVQLSAPETLQAGAVNGVKIAAVSVILMFH